MIRRLRVDLDDSIEPYQISTDQLYLLLQGAYMSIQRKSTQWKFLHVRGKLLRTVADKEDYITRDIEHVEVNSAYLIYNGEQRMPLCIRYYADWVIEQTAGLIRNGIPLYLIHNPDDQWKLDPIPEAVYDVYADYWLKPCEFRNVNDSPVWDEEFHEVVLLEAMKTARALKLESKAAQLMTVKIDTLLPELWRAFVNKYLPTTRSASTFL